MSENDNVVEFPEKNNGMHQDRIASLRKDISLLEGDYKQVLKDLDGIPNWLVMLLNHVAVRLSAIDKDPTGDKALYMTAQIGMLLNDYYNKVSFVKLYENKKKTLHTLLHS